MPHCSPATHGCGLCGHSADRTHSCTLIAFCGIRPRPRSLKACPPTHPPTHPWAQPRTWSNTPWRCSTDESKWTARHRYIYGCHAVRWQGFGVARTEPATKAHECGRMLAGKARQSHTIHPKRHPGLPAPGHRTPYQHQRNCQSPNTTDAHNFGCTVCAWPAGPLACPSRIPLGTQSSSPCPGPLPAALPFEPSHPTQDIVNL